MMRGLSWGCVLFPSLILPAVMIQSFHLLNSTGSSIFSTIIICPLILLLSDFSRTCVSTIVDKFKEGAVSAQKADVFHQACFGWVLNSTSQVWKYRKNQIPFYFLSNRACKLKQYFPNYLSNLYLMLVIYDFWEAFWTVLYAQKKL